MGPKRQLAPFTRHAGWIKLGVPREPPDTKGVGGAKERRRPPLGRLLKQVANTSDAAVGALCDHPRQRPPAAVFPRVKGQIRRPLRRQEAQVAILAGKRLRDLRIWKYA